MKKWYLQVKTGRSIMNTAMLYLKLLRKFLVTRFMKVLAEKLRSLIQRSYPAPRDVYDIWFLSENVSNLSWPEIIKAFHQKKAFKGLTFTGTDQLINDNNDKRLQNAWHNSLAHQVPAHLLPEYAVARNDLLGLFEHIFNE